MILLRKGIKLLIRIGRPFLKTGLFFVRNVSLKPHFPIVVIVLICGGLVGLYQLIIVELPNVNEVYRLPKLSTVITDNKGGVLYKFYDNEDRTWIEIEDVPQSVVMATIAIEDKEFFEHHGLSYRGILRALVYDIKKTEESRLRGGSTITQQLVKNIYFYGETGWKRKAKEAIMAILLESKMTKNEIMERYLNQVAYGGDAYGIVEAARRYFGKPVQDLTINEAAYLAGLIAAPGSYSPWGLRPDLAEKRRHQVLMQMLLAGYIEELDYQKIIDEPPKISKGKQGIVAPHFVFYVKQLVEEKYGYSEIGRMGLKIETTLDKEIQQEAEKIVAEEVRKAGRLGISNGGMLVYGIRKGEILAMVGSKDYWADDIDGKYNVTTALRQPGSAIKPLNYLVALKKGKTLMSMMDDSPVTYYFPGQKPYSPKNYTGKYMGKVTMRTALASSLNTPSVKLLAENGIEEMLNLGEKLGISTWKERNRFGLSLALGSGEVKMVELAQAYATIANLGEEVKINPIVRIQNYRGETVYSKSLETSRKIGKGETFLINQALSDDQARAPIFGYNSKLNIPGKMVAVKTGTTNNLKDNWCVGWTPSFLVASWVGNNDSKPMNWVASGVSGATPIWNRAMHLLIDDLNNENWPVPEDVVLDNVCGKNEYFLAGTKEIEQCQLMANGPTPILRTH